MLRCATPRTLLLSSQLPLSLHCTSSSAAVRTLHTCRRVQISPYSSSSTALSQRNRRNTAIAISSASARLMSSSAASTSFSSTSPSPLTNSAEVRVYIAIGGNSGHRARNLTSALSHLQSTPHIRLLNTSFLYETSPVDSPQAYAVQPRYLNGVIECMTTLSPIQLLDALQAIEIKCGRNRTQTERNAPRTVDLDLIFYRDVEYKMVHERLELPHPRWAQRGFVLAPMRDLLSPTTHVNSNTADATQTSAITKQVEHAWQRWGRTQSVIPAAEREEIYRVIPFPTAEAEPDSPLPALSDVWRYGKEVRAHDVSASFSSTPYPRTIAAPTHLMGVLNLTPDSFSDGGRITSTSHAVAEAARMWHAGATIIDVGGESTRPGALALSAADELERILPVIRAIRTQYPLMKLSVDTYHPSVARAAVGAGCVMINDVCGGTVQETKDDGTTETMLDVAAELNVPYVCMHIRGTPQTMMKKEYTMYDNVVNEVKKEQEQQFTKALTPRHVNSSAASSSSANSSSTAAASSSTPSSSSFTPSSPSTSLLYRWNLISDPGIGFAKTGQHAMELLRNLEKSRPFDSFPILVGTSRKGFIVRALVQGQKQMIPAQGHAATASAPSLEDRAFGTSATITASIQGGAVIVRVHDVPQMRCVRDVADQLYK